MSKAACYPGGEGFYDGVVPGSVEGVMTGNNRTLGEILEGALREPPGRDSWESDFALFGYLMRFKSR